MLYKDRIKNLSYVYPHLSRVWVKTDDPRTPLKSVWMSDTALHCATEDDCAKSSDTEIAEFADDHLLLAA
jgi:hypothetical protein